MEDTGKTGDCVIFRPSRRLRLLYLVYLLGAVWGGVLWWLIPLALAGSPATNLAISLPFFLVILWVVLWIPRYWKSMEYRFGREAVTFTRGVWFSRTTVLDCNGTTSTRVVRGPLSRLVGISEVRIRSGMQPSGGKNTGELRVSGVADPAPVLKLVCPRKP
jgi:membrane protein YdbS with pleckstrin-like domain